MKRLVGLGAVLGVVAGFLLVLVGGAAVTARAADGGAAGEASMQGELYERKLKAFEAMFRRLDQRDSPLQTEGSPEWHGAMGEILGSTEELLDLCRGIDGCLQDEKQGEMYRKMLVMGYADRAYVHFYGGGDRQAGLADLNRMAELEREDNESPRIIFWRGVIAAGQGGIDTAEKELETLRDKGSEATDLVEKLEKLLADKKNAAGR